jgi:thiosulfate sulfurtransferase
MDGDRLSVSAEELCGSLGTAAPPLIIDVRRQPAFDAARQLVAGAIRRTPETIRDWAKDLPAGRSVVVYCVHGHEVSQNAAAALRDLGIDARYLDGGIGAWTAASLPVRAKTVAATGQ